MKTKGVKDYIKACDKENLDLNCAEMILYGANEVYELGLDQGNLRIAAGFGGGMGIESVCGAFTGTVMVLSMLFVQTKAHDSEIYELIQEELCSAYQEEMGDIYCKPLKDKYYSEEYKCYETILKGAEILDEIVARRKEEVS